MFTTTQLIAIATLSSASLVSAFPNSIFVISNAETPSLGFDGLSPVGLQRAQECLPNLFGPSSEYDIGLIIACTPEVNTTVCQTAVDTVTPLATSLNLNVDISCGVRNTTTEECVNDVIFTFAAQSTQSVLVVWDRDYIDDLFDNFDLESDEPDFPEDSSDVIFTIRNKHFVAQTSENCPDIDGPVGGVPLLKTSGNKTAGSNSTVGSGITKNSTTTASASGFITSSAPTSTAISQSVQVSASASSSSADPTTSTGLVRRHQLMRRLSRRTAY
ncbi:hypothetical protein BD779DRAFT_1668387 [Infundibulicybe gibba]|nr:hypothetical protein BD779DRAFT_1668387 [Infundibulicybe gibba]